MDDGVCLAVVCHRRPPSVGCGGQHGFSAKRTKETRSPMQSQNLRVRTNLTDCLTPFYEAHSRPKKESCWLSVGMILGWAHLKQIRRWCQSFDSFPDGLLRLDSGANDKQQVVSWEGAGAEGQRQRGGGKTSQSLQRSSKGEGNTNLFNPTLGRLRRNNHHGSWVLVRGRRSDNGNLASQRPQERAFLCFPPSCPPPPLCRTGLCGRQIVKPCADGLENGEKFKTKAIRLPWGGSNFSKSQAQDGLGGVGTFLAGPRLVLCFLIWNV